MVQCLAQCVSAASTAAGRACRFGVGADSEEKREPVSDIDTVAAGNLKVLAPNGRLEKRTQETSPGLIGTVEHR